MASFLCFICHNTVNSDTNDVTREKYREIIGVNLCPDSNLCYVCQHMLNKLWLFKSVCYKRSLEYPVLFSEKGTINLQTNEIQTIIICPEDTCLPDNTHRYTDNQDYNINNDYLKLEHDHNGMQDYFQNVTVQTKDQNEDHFENDLINEMKRDSEIENDHSCVDFDNDKLDDGIVSDKLVGNPENDFESNKPADHFENDQVDGFDCGDDGFEFEGNGDEVKDDVNYVCYDEERSECLTEIKNEEAIDKSDTTKKKSKSKKNKNKEFEKIVLTAEEQKAELETQRRSKKYVEAEFKCYSCALGFLFKDTYQAHMMRHEESNGEYLCRLCSLRFATRAVLRSHSAQHSVLYRCRTCSQVMRIRQTHTHSRHCQNKVSEATCHLCGRVFQDGRGLQQHLKRFHMTKTSNRTYSCNICGQTYSNQAAVRTHMIKHIHRKFSCDQCPSTFSSPYTLTQHKKKHSIEQKEHMCTTCGIAYSSRKSLLAHKRNSINHQKRPHECPVCSRACPNARSLSSHVASVHSSSKDYKCPSCDARYSNRKSLVRHTRSHDTPPVVKPAVCHLCGNTFKGKSKLNRHLKEVCEKDKLEEELSLYYNQQNPIENTI
ncbi:PR domain zinc finger protein 5-like [Trichoplusia ni]|uniref:PR domain zinc finger protein 5-like n=1 Tax=Trichoplusia ni TaxID=7111 RepID=A0A7E5X3Z1_TRINI|nr:PR domain zinc finger protein 5-like [Trichoplusia ni]